MAARKERGSDVPYPLRRFEAGGKSLCLLDRTLSVLKQLDYDHIFMVVGFRHELFEERYGAENVRFVFNKDYAFTSSMGSLALVEPFVKEDFVLIESDTFFENRVLDELTATPYETCFSLTEESGSGDESFVQTRNGFVEKVSKDVHQMLHVDGEMVGVTKISLSCFHDMCRRYERSRNRLVGYEYLLLDCTHEVDRPFIRFPNLIWGEVDNERDFATLHDVIYRRLQRKENPYDRENLLSDLRTIFPDEGGCDRWTIEPIGGMSNKNFKVTSGGGSEYVLRLPGRGADGMVDRRNEDFNSLLASRLGLSPSVVWFDDASGIKLTTYVHNAETLNGRTVRRPDHLGQIAALLRTLHRSKVRMANEFNVFHEIVRYEALLSRAGGTMYEGWEAVRPAVMALEGRLNELGVEVCPAHNDLVPENFIYDENHRLWLIDWEYSGMNDPMADFAALFLESPFSDDETDFVLSAYYEGDVPQNCRLKIRVYQILWDCLWALWTVIKEAQGDDFGEYGQMRYRRAVEGLKRLTESSEG